MTVDPASTRANRINSESLDWSYIGILLFACLTTHPSARRHSPVDVNVPARHPLRPIRHEQRNDLRDVLRGPIATHRNFLGEGVGRSAQRVGELPAPGRRYRPRRYDVHADFARRETDRERT